MSAPPPWARLRFRTRLSGGADWLSYRREVSEARVLRIRAGRTSACAVVIHLHHPDLWDSIIAPVREMRPRLDVLVTGPQAAEQMLLLRDPSILADGRFFRCPNRGRDVLPFLMLMPLVSAAGYTSVLKLHSKKDAHHEATRQWRNRLLHDLVPGDPSLVADVLDTLSRNETGIVGPERSWLKGSVHACWSRDHVINELARARPGRWSSSDLIERCDELGFFAGTMFWARLDAIFPLSYLRPWDFERESGQTDGTMAHAVERLLSFLPALDGRQNYVMGRTGVRPAPAPSTPGW